ncbi:asparagine synthase (glutamine-hydrolyzing) [Candidatus Pacearchaeota archaeon CG10_big_fil_rev_8_21_14_0_10_31_24]|nr:MAG: asparagine synthase (glutamine-hydrolyzing) [Candidatus Pacearchaeota archaeon CG10_big_fil_rev_8_21_14_0_10_31_24]
MCGINGFNFEEKFLIVKMNQSLIHRGPDANDILIKDGISLGHQRLSIIDLTDNGKQPMCNESKETWITFNGEIYNYLEIRSELEKKGHKFKTDTDTEVIIHSYEEWGLDCVKKFNGMWAFCIFDSKKNIFFLSRDRFGKKPLYYHFKDNKFIFSSEINSILIHQVSKELNKQAVSSFLSYRYVLGESTFFKEIYKLPPAHNLIFDLNHNKIQNIEEYWDLKFSESDISESEAIKKVDELLKKSIAYRKISDVSLGVILSGGLDSSLLTGLLAKQEKNKINTFTVKFKEEGFDETEFAKIVSEKYKTNYFEVQLDTSNFLNIMREYMKYRDSPIGVPNEIALYLLSKKIKEKVTVVLSGEGADEVFHGYGKIFSSARDFEVLKNIQNFENPQERYIRSYPNLHKKYLGNLFENELDHFSFMYNYFSKSEKDNLLLDEANESQEYIFKKYIERQNCDYEKKISYIFLKLHLPGLLNRLDSPTMANSVEGRAPFLDHDLVEYVFNLPSAYQTKWLINAKDYSELDLTCEDLSEKSNISKSLLKDISKLYLPDEIINRKKQGFPLPLEEWFKGSFKETTQEILFEENSKIRQVINMKNLKSWIEEGQGKMFGQKLWMILSLELWLREWFK